MNKVCLIGRLTADAELKSNSNNKSYTRFNIAVNRNFTKANGEREADFISCVAWEKTAELINKYFSKGSQIGIEGRIQTGSYDKDNGEKVYTTDVIVENITFLDAKTKENTPKENQAAPVQVEQNDPFAEFGQSVVIDDNFLD